MYTMDELNDKLLSELKNITEELGIKGASKLSKQDLIYKILDEQAISKPKKSSTKKDKPVTKSNTKAKSKATSSIAPSLPDLPPCPAFISVFNKSKLSSVL